MFITFEGGEGSGKTTQSLLLKEKLEKCGHEVVLTREPGGTIFGNNIRALLLKGEGIKDPLTEFLLISAARREHVKDVIIPALQEGKRVICDRFLDSSVVYQSLVKGLRHEDLMNIHNISVPKIQPDITFLLDVDIGTMQSRILDRGSNHYDNNPVDFHREIRHAFLQLAKLYSDRIIVLDGSLDKIKISDMIVAHIK